MEQNREHQNDNNGLSVEVSSENIISSKKKDGIKTLEDTNCNLTILNSKKGDGLADGELISSCEKLSELSLNGPSKLPNGIDNSSENNCSLEENTNYNNVSSQCEPYLENSEPKNDSAVKSVDERNPDACNTSGKEILLCVNKCAEFNEESLAAESLTSDVKINKCDEGASSLPTLNPQTVDSVKDSEDEIIYVSYESEVQMPDIMRLIQKDLSEPYSIYTYRYFIHNWPQLCFLAMDKSTCVGAIVCKLDMHRKVVKRGYIAMLAVDEKYRKRKIGSNLVLKAIRAMVADGADEVVLETEITNKPALRLYENLGFVRDKRLFRYYLNGVDALRLKLWLR